MILFTVFTVIWSTVNTEFEAAEHRNTANQAPIHGVYCGQITVNTVTVITVNAVN